MGSLKSGTIYILTLIASLLTIFTGVEHLWGPLSADGRVGLIFLGLLVVFLLGFVAFQEYQFSRKARYAEALNHIHAIYAVCSKGTSRSNLGAKIEEVCSSLSHAYELITGTHCSACVKVINQKPEESRIGSPRLLVTTPFRDKTSKKTRRQGGVEVTHWLDANTDCQEIFDNIKDPKGRAFFANNLHLIHEYKNTSFALYGHPEYRTIPVLGWEAPYGRWPLPYRSTIVSPIIPLSEDPSKSNLLGFLCVDSRSRGVFSERYDIELMCNIAGVLYPLLEKWWKKNRQGGIDDAKVPEDRPVQGPSSC